MRKGFEIKVTSLSPDRNEIYQVINKIMETFDKDIWIVENSIAVHNSYPLTGLHSYINIRERL